MLECLLKSCSGLECLKDSSSHNPDSKLYLGAVWYSMYIYFYRLYYSKFKNNFISSKVAIGGMY